MNHISQKNNIKYFHWLVLLSMCFGAFTPAFTTTSIMSALPSIKFQFGMSATSLEWVINAYTVVAATLIVATGKLCDIVNKRLIFNSGIILLFISSILIIFATSTEQFITLRVIQGISAALMVPSALSILKTTFPPNKLGLAISIWAATMSLSMGIGPFLGGWLTVTFSWESIFIFVAIANIVAFVIFNLTSKHFDLSSKIKDKSLDLIGVGLLILFMFPLTFVLVQGNSLGWGSGIIIMLSIISIIFLILFIYRENVINSAPLIDLNLFKNLNLIFAITSYFISFFVIENLIYIFSLYSQKSHLMAYTPLMAGAALLPLTLITFMLSFFTPKLLKDNGTKLLFSIGFLLMFIGFILLAITNTISGFIDIWYSFAIIGASMSIASTLAPGIGMASIPANKAGEASGILSTTIYLAATIGIALGTVTYINSSNIFFWV